MDCKMETLYCPICKEWRNIEVRCKRETYHVKGENIEIDALVSYCTHCGGQIFNPDLDDKNLKEVFRQYQIRVS